jgi:hypothetical protein
MLIKNKVNKLVQDAKQSSLGKDLIEVYIYINKNIQSIKNMTNANESWQKFVEVLIERALAFYVIIEDRLDKNEWKHELVKYLVSMEQFINISILTERQITLFDRIIQ